tara:strand:+ start:7682 stop:7981 length:300 start_codon:yes stop_codon:yes gene_type:complete
MIKILSLLLLSSCFGKTEFTKDECETLSLESYRGSPKSAHQLQEYCTQYKLTYTKKHCQKAFELLILESRPEVIKKKFGDRALECFDQRQTDKFLNPKN